MPEGRPIPNAKFFAPFGLGGSPLWAVGQGVPPAGVPTAQTTASPISVVTAAGPTDLGWFLKILWVIEPGQDSPISLSGQDPEGKAVLFDINGAGPAAGVVLDPAQPAIPIQHGGWAEFPSYVYFPLPGCYTFEAHWNEGSWSVQFPFTPPDPS